MINRSLLPNFRDTAGIKNLLMHKRSFLTMLSAVFGVEAYCHAAVGRRQRRASTNLQAGSRLSYQCPETGLNRRLPMCDHLSASWPAL